MNEVKRRIIARVDAMAEELLQLSHAIHARPELGMHEYFAAGEITGLLHSRGFEAVIPYGGLETAFRADAPGAGCGPGVAILAEYDALPGCGHGCGHNIIAASSSGAFLALAEEMPVLAGRLSLIGTPGEEGKGGKIILLDNGAFTDINYCLMIHPTSGQSVVCRGGRAAVHYFVEFTGREAHSSNPALGINALSAVILLFNMVDSMRPLLPPGSNINGVILDGGKAANVIPGYARCEFSIRATTLDRLKEIIGLMEQRIQWVEEATEAIAGIECGPLYAERYTNLPISRTFKKNMALLGVEMEYAVPGLYGSSDIGNVSLVMPAVHEYISVCPEAIPTHSAEFAEKAASPGGDEVVLNGAKGLAMTALDIFTNAELRQEAQDCFRSVVPQG